MSVKVRIPSPLRTYTGGADIVESEGATVGGVLDGLKAKAAGIETRLFKGPNQLNRFVRRLPARQPSIRFYGERDRDRHRGCLQTTEKQLLARGSQDR